MTRARFRLMLSQNNNEQMPTSKTEIKYETNLLCCACRVFLSKKKKKKKKTIR